MSTADTAARSPFGTIRVSGRSPSQEDNRDYFFASRPGNHGSPRGEAGFGELALKQADGRPHVVGFCPIAIRPAHAREPGACLVIDSLDELPQRGRLVQRLVKGIVKQAPWRPATLLSRYQFDSNIPMSQYPQINVRVDTEFLERLDAWRRKQRDLPTRPEALRRLADRALMAKQIEPAPKRKRASRAREG